MGVVLSEPDPQRHCQLPTAQVSHGSRDEQEAPQTTLVETSESKDEFEGPQTVLVETSESKDKFEGPQTMLVETPRSINKLEAQVHTPSSCFVSAGLNSSDYLHSAPTDKQWSFRIIT